MARQVRLTMSKADLLMSALINCNNNYTGRRYGSPSFARNTVEKKSIIKQHKLKNVTPPKKEGVNE